MNVNVTSNSRTNADISLAKEGSVEKEKSFCAMEKVGGHEN